MWRGASSDGAATCCGAWSRSTLQRKLASTMSGMPIQVLGLGLRTLNPLAEQGLAALQPYSVALLRRQDRARWTSMDFFHEHLATSGGPPALPGRQ